MTKQEIIKKMDEIVANAKKENRGLTQEEEKRFNELEKMFDVLKTEERVKEMENELRAVEIPEVKKENEKTEIRKIIDAMIEKRGITVNGAGAVNVVNEIVKEVQNKTDITKGFRYFYGANANTVIPILSPSLAVPAGQSEGATSISEDSQAVVSGKSLLPKAYVSILPVSAEALQFIKNIENQLPSIFSDAFAQAIFEQSIIGDGTGNNFKGIFASDALSNSIDCENSGAPTGKDLIELALALQDYNNPYIIINNTFVSSILSDTNVDTAIKQEILNFKSVMGVKLFITKKAPSATTTGSIVAVGLPLNNYGVAVASELIIDPIKVKGDTNTYFQATMFLNGTTIVPKNGYKLITV